jgi:hypothetical protein
MDSIIKLTNRLALLAIALLIYWVFIFVAVTVFNFKIFRENLTEVFYLSVLAIFALLGGAIIVNVMFNLTKISAALSDSSSGLIGNREMSTPRPRSRRMSRRTILAMALSFPVIFGLLFLGDLGSAQKKKAFLVAAAEQLVSENQATLKALANYTFTSDYLKQTGQSLKVLSRVDENFPEVSIIVQDQVGSKSVFLNFGQYYNDDERPDPADYIYAADQGERQYLQAVFNQQQTRYHFSAHDGFYELYYPVTTASKPLVLYFSDQAPYGKYGS